MKTTLITGASSGIGLELAHIMAFNNHNLFLVARNTAKLEQIKEELQKLYPVSVTILSADLSLPDAALKLFQFAQQQQMEVDVLINGAGYGLFGPFRSTSWEKESDMIALNIKALTQLIKLFYPEMVKTGGGKILNIASIAAFQPGPLMAVYYASKAYVLSLTEALANEAKGTGVTFTALCPGPTSTGFADAADLGTSRLFKLMPVDTSPHVALVGYKAMMKGKPVAIPGFFNKLIVAAVRISPRKMVTALVRYIQGEQG